MGGYAFVPVWMIDDALTAVAVVTIAILDAAIEMRCYRRFWIDAKGRDIDKAILVGHSHMFRAMVKSLMDSKFKAEHPAWARALSRKKLDNGACLCIEVRRPNATL